MFVKTLELAQSSDSSRLMYSRFILAALAICVVLKTGWFARLGSWDQRILVDFDVFYIAGQRVWLGDIVQAYDFAKMMQMELEATHGAFKFLPWSYPPQFTLLIAPLALLPLWAAYFLFTAATLGFYLVVLRMIAGTYFALTLILLFPVIAITIGSGQNGFLTGGLIGVACLAMPRRQVLAGLALGMMVIKPHLAIGFAVYTFLKRSWTAVLFGVAVVLATSVLATILLSQEIWSAFLASAKQSSIHLEHGYYPLFRLISPYAALRMLNAPSWGAFLVQGVVAILGVAMIAVAVYQKLPCRQSLGLTAVVSVLLSPYTVDYDLTILGVGLALLLPDLMRSAKEYERGAIYALVLLTGSYGLLQSLRLQLEFGSAFNLDDHWVPSVGGITLFALFYLISRIMLRGGGNQMKIEKKDDTALVDVASPAISGKGSTWEVPSRTLKKALVAAVDRARSGAQRPC
jgi:hypothetical protein